MVRARPSDRPGYSTFELVHRPTHFDLKYRPDNEPGDPVVSEAKYDVSKWTALRVSFFFGP